MLSLTGSWAINNIEYGANTIISIPSPITGIIIIGSTSITYYNLNGNQQSVEISPTMVLSYVSICNDGTRYLYSDHRGLLSVLALRIDSSYGNGYIIIGGSSSSYLGINDDNVNINNHNNTIDNVISSGSNTVTSIVVDMIGTTSIATSLAYLSYAILYIGSQYGDNQLIKLYPERKMMEDDDSYDVEDDDDDRDHDQIIVDDILIDNDDDNINNNYSGDRRSKSSNSNKMSRYNDTSSSNSSRSNNNNMFEILSTYTNIGPILDMCLIEHDKHSGGQRQLITCSGAYNDGTLHIFYF